MAHIKCYLNGTPGLMDGTEVTVQDITAAFAHGAMQVGVTGNSLSDSNYTWCIYGKPTYYVAFANICLRMEEGFQISSLKLKASEPFSVVRGSDYNYFISDIEKFKNAKGARSGTTNEVTYSGVLGMTNIMFTLAFCSPTLDVDVLEEAFTLSFIESEVA